MLDRPSRARSMDIVSAAILRIAEAADEIDRAYSTLPDEVKDIIDNSVLQQLNGRDIRHIEADMWEG